jgi:hypothetical protein
MAVVPSCGVIMLPLIAAGTKPARQRIRHGKIAALIAALGGQAIGADTMAASAIVRDTDLPFRRGCPDSAQQFHS